MDAAEKFKFMRPGQVRTRFAPSPTGVLHIGSARTCLFNYLFSRKYKGVLVLRIEDTDDRRSKKEYEQEIIQDLKWLGIKWDEGPDIGDGHGPYRQSERINIYSKYLKKLLDEDKAYYCFCSPEEIEERKQYLISVGRPPIYSGNCARFKKEEVEEKLAKGEPSVIRFRTLSKKLAFKDAVRDKVEFDTDLIGDFVIAKDLSHPLYNFACVVDDFEMRISHVIRGEDHISNTPKQILIQEALDFPQPLYAHLPLILGPDRSKLSKRHGAVSLAQYKKEGYLPETLINFLAFLGWNPGGDREIYSIHSLINDFSLEKIHKGGAVFNQKRLDWLNGFYLRRKSLDKLMELCLPFLVESGLIEPTIKSKQYPPAYGGQEISQGYRSPETGEGIALDYIKRTISIYHKRLKKLSEIVGLTDFFFKRVITYEKGLLRWKEMNDKGIKGSLDKSAKVLSKIKERDWTKEKIEEALKPISETYQNRGYILWPLRVALTGKQHSAGPFEIAEILGREITLERIKAAKKILKSK